MATKANKIQLSNQKIKVFILGLSFFCFSVSAALIFQKLLLPNLTSILAPGTTLTTDSAYFDSVAVEMAQQIKQHGWNSWHMFPNDYSGIHVSILAALYAVFGHDTTLAIPLNALFHAFGGVLIFVIAIELSSSYLVGFFAGIVASCIFVLFPSALNWYGQIHKDGYAIAGLLAILLIWCKGLDAPPRTANYFLLILMSFLMLCFLVTIRGYYFKLLLMFVGITLIAMIVIRVLFKQKSAWAFFLGVLLTFLPVHIYINSIDGFSGSRSGEAYFEYADTDKDFEYHVSDLLPTKLDRLFESVARTRKGLLDFGVKSEANSMIDVDDTPGNAVEVIKHLPRAFQVALLAPFPTTWLKETSIARLLASGEMVVIYISLFGLIPLFKLNRRPQVMLAFFFSAFFLTIYGFIITNVGTLYRVRYTFELIMVLLGVIGWFTYLDKNGMFARWLTWFNRSPEPVLEKKLKNVIANESSTENFNRKNVIGAGIMVSILTFVGFIGFFLRDLLMVYEFGFSKSLDEFYLALLMPMFFVTIFCMPLGATLVPFLSRFFEKNPGAKVDKIISHLVAIVLGVMFLISTALYFLSPAVFEALQMADSNQTGSGSLLSLLALASVIAIFSGVVILGNSVLMVKHRLIIPSAAQVVVPVISIFALLLFGSSYGVVAVMAGMVAGQLINLIIIHYYLKSYGKSLLPKYNAALNHETSDLWRQYFPLLASAFFVGVMLPINTLLASTLANGNVSIFLFGMKIVLFVSGLLAVVVSNVMLPYFSSIAVKYHAEMVKKELAFFMLLATFASVPISAMLYLWAEQIVSLIFYSETSIESDLVAIQSVVQYSVVQLPFFTSNILLLKYATATRHLRVIVISAFVGLLLNVGVSLLLMPKMGVSGIALATSVAMIASSSLILLMLSFFRHVSIVDTLVVLLNWMLFLTLIVALHFQSIPSAVMIIITYGILLFGHIKVINHKNDFLTV